MTRLDPADPRARRSGLRTQAVALVAWAAGAGALASALYPVLAAALFAFLTGLVMVATLRSTLRRGLAAGAIAAVPFAFAERTLDAISGAAGHEGVAYLLLGVALLLGSAVVADAASAAIGRLPAGGAGREPEPGWREGMGVSDRDAGLRRADWELARAAEYQREVTLALVGLDVPPGADGAAARVDLMQRLDGMALESVTRFDVVCEYGLYERLMVLPEESASSVGEGASRLCAVASERLGRTVRMALASFPAHGSTLRALLTELEIDLAACRANGVAVQVCGAADHAAPAYAGGGREPLLLLEPDEGTIGAPAGLVPPFAPGRMPARVAAEDEGRVVLA